MKYKSSMKKEILRTGWTSKTLLEHLTFVSCIHYFSWQKEGGICFSVIKRELEVY